MLISKLKLLKLMKVLKRQLIDSSDKDNMWYSVIKIKLDIEELRTHYKNSRHAGYCSLKNTVSFIQ